MYHSLVSVDYKGVETEHIFCVLPNGHTQMFENVESNDGPERKAYLEWVAAGNEPEIIESEV